MTHLQLDGISLGSFISIRFKLCMETWKLYVSWRSRAIFRQLMLNGLLLQLDVLIDDSGKYVLPDFGLSHAKADAISHTVQDGGFIVGCHNWMTPDRLRFIEEAFWRLSIWNYPARGQCWLGGVPRFNIDWAIPKYICKWDVIRWNHFWQIGRVSRQARC